MPLADMVSTLYSLTRDSQEIGILAKPIYEQYGELGLIALSSFMVPVLLVCVWFVRFGKTKCIQGQASKRERSLLAVAFKFFFAMEGYWMAIIITNLILPPTLLILLAIWCGVTFAYFVLVNFFTQAEMRRLIRN